MAMTAIFAMQAYWIYNQYEYSSTVKAEELKQACTKALEEEKNIRLDKQEDGKDDSSYVRMQIVLKIDQSTKKTKEKDRQVKSTIRYTLPDTKKQLKVRNIDMTEGVELTSRYMASQEKRFDRNIFDSLLYADEGIKTDSFRFVKTNRCMIKPAFSVSGGLRAHPINSGERKKILSLHHGKFNVRVFGKLHAAIQYIIPFYNSKSRK